MAGDITVKILTVTEDVRECPACGAPAVKDDERSRHCNTCGLVWVRITEADELDMEADRAVRSRGTNEDAGRAKSIAKHQTRW